MSIQKLNSHDTPTIGLRSTKIWQRPRVKRRFLSKLRTRNAECGDRSRIIEQLSSLTANPCTVLSCKANMPQPLPNNPFPAGTPAHQAYTTCQTLEAGVPLVNRS